MRAFDGVLIKDYQKEAQSHPYQAEFIIGLLFVLLVGFFGVQKLIYVATNPSATYNIYSLNESACEGGFRLPFLSCEKEAQEDSKNIIQSNNELKNELVNGLNQAQSAPRFRQQFAQLPDLKTALQKLRWNNGDEQDAARLLSIIGSLENGRQRESYQYGFIPSIMTSLLDPVWDKFPDLVAASHCLYCGSFYRHVLESFLLAGAENNDRINTLAVGHPRFLQTLYKSGSLNLTDITSIAKLQAELLTSGDADTAQFIGDILRKDADLEMLRIWSSKGWNGSYALSRVPNLNNIPYQTIIDAWQRGISRGADNAVLTRYLVSTGYRAALRWLIWYHAGNLSYFQRHQRQHEKDRYNNFLVDRYLNFPKESLDDLSGFYSKHWQDIFWDKSKGQWVYKKL